MVDRNAECNCPYCKVKMDDFATFSFMKVFKCPQCGKLFEYYGDPNDLKESKGRN